MSTSLPQPATVSVDRRRPGLIHGLRSRWTRFKQSRNTGSSPSNIEKDFPFGGGSTEASVSVTGAPDEPQRKRDVYYAIPKGHASRDGEEHTSRFRSARRRTSRPQGKPSEPVENDADEIVDVDVVVVDNSFEVGGQQESLTEPSAGPNAAEHQPAVAMQPGPGKMNGGFGWDPKDKQNGLNLSSSQTHSQHDTGSMAHTGVTSMYIQTVLRSIRYVFSVLNGVFFPHFDDVQHEKQFYSQEWYLGKMLALIATGFLVLNWVLACIFVPRPFVLFDYIFHFAIAPIFTLPLPVFIILRFPIRYPIFYQTFLTISLWSWTYWYGISLVLCGYYSGHSLFTCGGKDFLGLFYFCTGFPAIGLFALGQRRFPAAVAAGVTLTLMGVFVIPYRTPWIRIVINQIVFHAFLIYINWSREMADRDRFVMSRQIKEAYLYRHRLQMREKQIQNSKQRLTGYIFHEVRVPLNTAMLAVQNIEASGSVIKPLELEFNALTGSLTVMSKVLNDVLDLNRMDAGKFESVNKPYVFHKVIELLLVPLRLAASAKGINLIEELDPRIDQFVLECLIAAKKLKGSYDENEELDPLVVGDEMRCRQIFTNLTSNATKFCPPGGTVTVVTKLLWPSPPGVGATPPVGPSDPEWHGIRSENVSSKTAASEHDGSHSNGQLEGKTDSNGCLPSLANLKEQEKGKRTTSMDETDYMENPTVNVPVDQVVIRIEVRDTGIGIKKKDVHDAKLFSPYVQTEIGRHQGGKGTGLGLALVRRIVKLSGGRLGVKSKFQQGSCFWVELPLGVGNRALHAQSTEGNSREVSIRSRSLAPTRARDFAIDQSSVYTNPNNDNSARASFSLSPPAPHFSHRTIMEQQGRVEMTPSRPELRYRRETPAPAETVSSKLAATQSFTSDTQAMVAPQRTLENPRSDTSSSAPPAFEQEAAPNSVPITPPDESISKRTAAKAARPPATSEPLQILVVDDDTLTRKLMTRLLTRIGCVVTTAENGAKALEILLGPIFTPSESATPSTLMPGTPGTTTSGADNAISQPRFFDVVFLDNQMPLMSGLEAIARLRAAGREDLVVGVTGNALIRDQDEYLNAGVDHVLIKPVLEKSLKQMLSLGERRRKLPVEDNAADEP